MEDYREMQQDFYATGRRCAEKDSKTGTILSEAEIILLAEVYAYSTVVFGFTSREAMNKAKNSFISGYKSLLVEAVQDQKIDWILKDLAYLNDLF